MKKTKIIIGLTALLMSVSLTFLTACGFFASCFESGNSSSTESSSGNSSSGNSSNGNSNSGNSNNGNSQKPEETIVVSTEPVTIEVRKDTAYITDSGRKNQKMDVVFLSNYFDAKKAYKSGYTKVNITFSFDVREHEDGYQYVFFYSDRNCKSNKFFDQIVDEFYDPDDPSLLYEYRFEHGGSGLDTNWSTHTFSATLKMSRLVDDLYIRYGASGYEKDDWENKNVVVTFQVSK